jgi:hypothetical protein
MNARTIQLKSPDQRQPYGVADLRTQPGNVLLWLGTEAGSMGFGLDLSPACARELAAELLAQADAADQEGAAA